MSRALLLPDASVSARRTAIDAALAGCCDQDFAGVEPEVANAIRYALLGEGKRLRGLLVCAAFDAVGGVGDPVPLGTAVEVVHAYSLVHDDLPCMDDDDVRRGRPTVHRVFGVATATAAGLAMVPLAAREACNAAAALGLAPEVRGAIVRELMRAAGAGGMIGGQLLDLEGEGHVLDVAGLERIHRAKTGALITAAVVLGGLAGGVDEARLQALRHYGEAIGLAFQIADDVLDVTATTDELGKTAGRDLDLRKSTYPALLGVEGATERARALVEEACSALEAAGLLTPGLEQVARFTVARRS